MKDNYCDITNISIDKMTDDGTIIYAQKFENTVSYVDAKEEKDGSVLLHFTEGNLENTIKFADNSIYLDGKEVNMEVESALLPSDENTLLPCSKTSLISSSEDTAVLRGAGGLRSTFQKSVLGGTRASDYTGRSYVYNSTAKVDFEAEFFRLLWEL